MGISKSTQERFAELRETILNLWHGGATAPEISLSINRNPDWIRSVVNRARRNGDYRAEVRNAFLLKPDRRMQKPAAPPPAPVNRMIRQPDYSNLDFTGHFCGDPPRGRSALDRKRAEAAR